MAVSLSPAVDPASLAELNAQFEHQDATSVVRWAARTWAPDLALTCSFGGSSGMVLLDLALREDADIPVLVLDTDLLFAETYALIEQIERHYRINVQRVRPGLSLDEQARLHGPALHERDPDACCGLRKVAPLAAALHPYAAWLTAVRRDQSATRAATPIVSWNAKHSLVKICPLATWAERDVWRYLHANKVPYNPLLDQGYTSLGCRTCTRLPNGDDPRSGRWAGFAKTECGLHS